MKRKSILTSPKELVKIFYQKTSISLLLMGLQKSPTKMQQFIRSYWLKKKVCFLGNSAGAAIKGVLQLKEQFTKDDVVVVLFHDHGSRYVGKMFNNDWMRNMGYID